MKDFYWKILDNFCIKMVYIDSWDEYVKAVEQLCLEEPSKVIFSCLFGQL
jgi:hypothetical protein